MIPLFAAALTASFADSLNPSAIAQQLLLQAMVPKKRHTLCFIAGLGVTNIVMGLAIYYGVVRRLKQALALLAANAPLPLYGVQTAAGLLCLLLGVFLVHRALRCREHPASEAKPPRSLSPLSLFVLGVAFCFVELTSAMPYFGFLAFLSGYDLSFLPVLTMLALYTLIYAAPLLLVYFAYNRLRHTRFLQKTEAALQKISRYIIPAALCLLGGFLAAGGASSLQKLL